MGERLRAMQKDVAAIEAILESPIDEGERRALKKRVARVARELSALEGALAGEATPPAPEPPPPTPPEPEKGFPNEDFEALLTSLHAARFGSERTNLLETSLELRDVTVAQAARLLATFPFSGERVEAARFIVPRLSDPERAFKLIDAMQFQSDKDELKEIIKQARSR
jgi:hypothetical protein